MRQRRVDRQPKLSSAQQAHLVMLHVPGDDSITELAELFSVSRSTVYRVLSAPSGHELGAGHRQGTLTQRQGSFTLAS